MSSHQRTRVVPTPKFNSTDSNVFTGALAGKADTVAAVRSMHNVLGGTIDPFAAFLLLRGMKTLGIRVNQHNRSALEIAKRLESHPKIQRVRDCSPVRQET